MFPYLSKVDFDPGTFGYEGAPAAGANVKSLITGPTIAGLGTSTLLGDLHDAGRSPDDVPDLQREPVHAPERTRCVTASWTGSGANTYFGDQRNYLETDIDDNFLSDDAWSVAGNADTAPHSTDFNPADALREVPADVTQAATWSKANNFRIDMLFNGGGSVAVADGDSLVGAGDGGSGGTGSTGGTGGTVTGVDPLLGAFTATDPSTGKPYTGDFGWISHTWDHPNIDEGCATQNYIEAELNQNTAWGTKAVSSTAGNPTNGGLGLTSSTDPTAALGTDNPQVVVTGEHSGLANLLPGNPGQVDPPALDDATPAADATSTLPAGDYVYAVSDQFNTAGPGATPVAGTGESAASISSPVTVAAGQSVGLTWGAVCHAAGYIVYRAPYTAPVAPATTGTIGAWSTLGTVAANTTTDFTNPTGNSTTSTTGGGAIQKTFTDTGAAGTLTTFSGPPTATSKPASEGTAVESPYEQNPMLDAAFAATTGGGIKYFGADASKPYPTPADGSFGTGDYTGAQVPAGGTFQDAGGTGIPRYPTNIYYNVSSNAQEVDEYQTLYDEPTCVPIAGVTTCNPAGTQFSISQIVASVDQGMFAHMMGNDPRPHYFHQTNLMSQTNGGVNGSGDGLFYETMNPLLAQYGQYFNSTAPIEQLTMAQIGTLLTNQANWANVNGAKLTGSIEGNVVTVTNSTGGQVWLPLTGYHRWYGLCGDSLLLGSGPRGHDHVHGTGHLARAADHACGRDSADRALAHQRRPPARSAAGAEAAGADRRCPQAGCRRHLLRGPSGPEDGQGQPRQGDRVPQLQGLEGPHSQGQDLRRHVHADGRRPQGRPLLPVQVGEGEPDHGQAAQALDECGHGRRSSQAEGTEDGRQAGDHHQAHAQVLSQRQGDAHDQGLTRTRRAHSSDRVRPPTR